MTPQDALAALEQLGDAEKAVEMEAYHKIERRYLGVPSGTLDAHAKDWRQTLSLLDRLSLAQGLWETDVFEARITAAKLLTQARIRPDDTPAWDMIQSWVPEFDSWAIADAVSSAGSRRLIADPMRLDVVEGWTTSDHLWTQRAALVMTLPWTKQSHPEPTELEARERILVWAAGYVANPEWFIQKAIAWWLRDLSKRDPERVRAFVTVHGDKMSKFARTEAQRLLKPA